MQDRNSDIAICLISVRYYYVCGKLVNVEFYIKVNIHQNRIFWYQVGSLWPTGMNISEANLGSSN